jgi:hypothetical protein
MRSKNTKTTVIINYLFVKKRALFYGLLSR